MCIRDSGASFEVEPDAPGSADGGAQLELYRHSETFESNYNIDLEKYCAETNQPLEGTAFYVWEDFDFSQINTDGYTEGEPDGSTGEVYLNRMLPEPETGYICDTINTCLLYTSTAGHMLPWDAMISHIWVCGPWRRPTRLSAWSPGTDSVPQMAARVN